MGDYDLYFEQLIFVFADLLDEECSGVRAKLSKGEVTLAAYIGLFYADSTYRRENLDFEIHVRNSVR